MPSVFSLAQIIQQLQTQWGGSYEGTTESWAGTSPISYYIGSTPYSSGSGEIAYWTPMTALMTSRAALAFELWDDLIARDLIQATTAASAQIQFEYATRTYNGSGVLSTNGGTYSFDWTNGSNTNSYGTTNYKIARDEIWLNSNWTSHNADNDMFFGGYGFQTYMHEIGHSLGLSHPGTYNAGSGGSITYANSAEYTLDNRQYTIMSYFGGYAPGAGWQQDGTFSSWLYSSTPMLDDVAAIQAIYGADMTTRAGNTTYGFHSNAGRDVFDFTIDKTPIVTLWDAGGTDTIDLSGYSANQRIDLHAGTYSDVGGMLNNVAIAYNVTIENAIGGSGNDTFYGNDADNRLTGGAGNDVMDGGGGTDTAVFSGVFASYSLVDLGGTSVRVSGPDGIDTLSNIESLQFSDQMVSWPVRSNLVLAAFGSGSSAGGWSTNDVFSRVVADVNGDGLADVVGFGNWGVNDALATGGGHFAQQTLELMAFGACGSAGGWTSDDVFPRTLADVNGDGMADVVGFGAWGVNVALATGGGHFAQQTLELMAFGASGSAGGWSSDNAFPRTLADVNGDGMADVVGFGAWGVNVALATGSGHFAQPTLELMAFGASGSAGGWSSNDLVPRTSADVNGDGMADVVGFGIWGVSVALATGGGHFAQPTLELAAFGADGSVGGWTSNDIFPRTLADVNGDGMADVVGFGAWGVNVALATGGGHFAQPKLALGAFGADGSAGGWSSNALLPRTVADVDGDGKADVIGFDALGVHVALATDFHLA
jgi:peptidase M10/serralysin-like protein/VCBS repeat protein/matrixin